ncbi:hypothetical protein ACIGXM_21580 [Kitasatospora sp. NPDC052896]|uniref:hypothetical protein n=1 Tax=Kitasatospora sp. NPDC052896 TaxID=3364061 RepID=UPI0037C51333
MPGSTRSAASARPVRAAALGALGVVTVLATVSGCAGTGAKSTDATAATTAPATGRAAGQLSAAQLPDGAAEGWQPLAAPRVQAVTSAIQLNECASVQGAADWQQQAYVSVHRTPAEQDLFTFSDGSAAGAAYQSLLTQMAGCQAASRALQTKSLGSADAQVTTTATTAGGTAWSRRWTGVEGLSAGGPQTDHLYAVQRGSALAVVHFDEWDATHAPAYDTRSDGALLTSIARQLA